jgi:hypothetical protein
MFAIFLKAMALASVCVVTTRVAAVEHPQDSLADRASAQDALSTWIQLPESVNLSDAQIQWQSGGGDGCAADIYDCAYYRIILRADGVVTLEDLGWGDKPPKTATRQRSIPAADVIALINQMFDARFMGPENNFHNGPIAVRKGESLFLYGSSGGIGARWVELTLRIGAVSKTVRLGGKTPTDLLRVRDRIWEIGGPKTWPIQ